MMELAKLIKTATDAEPLLKRAFLFLEDKDWESADIYCEKTLDQNPENAFAYLGKLMASERFATVKELISSISALEENDNYKKIIRFGSEELCHTILTLADGVKDNMEAYTAAAEAEKNAASYEDLREALDMFAAISGYRDATERARSIKSALSAITYFREAWRRGVHKELEAKKAAAENELMKTKLAIAESQSAVKRLEEAVREAEASIEKMTEERKGLGFFAGKRKKALDAEIQSASARLNAVKTELSEENAKSKRLKNPEKLAAKLAELEKEISELPRNEIKQSEDETDGALRIPQNITDALALLKNTAVLKLVAADAYAFSAILKTAEGAELIVSQKSLDALKEAPQRLAAVALITAELAKHPELIGILPVRERLAVQLSKSKTVLFGSYPTDQDGTPRPVEWTVIKHSANKYLLLSSKLLDCQPYHEKENVKLHWGVSDLRAWMHNAMLPKLFSDEEQALLVEAVIDTGGIRSRDKIFIPSEEEALQLRILKTPCTDFMMNKGSRFWLRSKCSVTYYNTSTLVNMRAINFKYAERVNSLYFNAEHILPMVWIDLG